ncbi:MAG: Minf_1886 family protein [Candidatus Latescibacterota bacterium]|jgi:uncharacterized repeat protein (TIGR04138 family)
MSHLEIIERIDQVAEKDGRYKKEAYLFILAALEHTIEKLPEIRHLNGAELSRGISECAREQYGYMARDVLEYWKIRNTMDYGEIVYLLIQEGIMSKTEGDRKEDFANVYDFDLEFTWERSKPTSFPSRF